MDDFPGLLARDFGFKPQGKSSPMVPSRGNAATTTSYSLGSGSRTSNSYYPAKSAPIFDDHDRRGGGGGADLLFNDVFGGPPKYTEPQPQGGGATPSSFDYDAMFNDQSAKSSSLPAYDKPVYDDDIFDGLPGIKSASSNTPAAVPASGKFDDVFASMGATASAPKRRAQNSSSSPFDDLLGNLGNEESTEQIRRKSAREKDASPVFDDLLPGFGRSSSPGTSRSISDSSRSQKPSSDLGRTVSGVMDDPFVILQSTSTAPTSSAVLFTDPSEDIGKFTSSGSTKGDNSYASKGVFDDLHHLENLGRSVPPVSSEINKRGKDQSPLRGGSTSGTYSPASKESFDKYRVENAEGYSQRTVPLDDFQESSDTVFDMPTSSSDFRRSARPAASPPSYVNASANETNFISKSEDISESSDDIWLTVLEIPLFTRPTSAPPPSRPPPPRPPRIPKSETGSFSSPNSRRKCHEYFSNSSAYSQVPSSACAERNIMSSQRDELEDFAMATAQNSVNERADVFSEDGDASSVAAMKEAMGKAQAKFRQAREREYLKAARSKEAGQVDRDMQDMQQRESRERQERIDRERQQREKEEEEREQRRLEKEREREEKEREERRLERERERVREAEREREKDRQAVERATREARERAATEAWMKAERAAAEKAATEAQERTERAAVQRAQAEARERAAAEARERVEKAAAEARERANAKAREREAMERAAAAKAEADARFRAERAAVERVAAEARQRAAAAARANQQRNENQQKNENDLESFFSSRANSAPRTRASAADPFFDTQNKGVPEAAGRTSFGSTTNTRKASSAANIVDDLSSIFGAAVPSGEFQEVEGETEERRRARLERHQRTQERAAKALAEKNQRDFQVQREQAERHRIAETLDVEIKRWAAGKEGNLRALLSTLQYVLWPECGWQPVSLTDLITAASVKKVYRKATLCIHPDKVQQKGANLQQKYIAEKVFDLLKEAWNKFNSEELF